MGESGAGHRGEGMAGFEYSESFFECLVHALIVGVVNSRMEGSRLEVDIITTALSFEA